MPDVPLSRRRVVVALTLKPDTPDEQPALEALDEALRVYVLADGEEWEVLSDERVAS